jgi:gliding motility-associated protein GldC
MSAEEEKIQTSREIRIRVGLDESNVPAHLEWDADDLPDGNAKACKGVLVSLFDAEQKDTLKIDLWTKSMQVVEMDRFMYQTLRGLADTYFKATQNKELAVDMQRFVHYFGEKTGAIPKPPEKK